MPTRPPVTPTASESDPYTNDYSTGAVAATVIIAGTAAAAIFVKRKQNIKQNQDGQTIF